ncbi:hypothetical protein D9613_003391 [Agrocybe pediades]|uniref:Aminoglycoside phosphotransferase domain-containing protein n=1 Tax=Agrocybe pediades TaxID=84607 RepID=A0A8H4VKX7_9AGAR|nr:hypothetical protein D9613_003391 [Agrocybe pediades]
MTRHCDHKPPWIPKSFEEAWKSPKEIVIFRGGIWEPFILNPVPGVILKCSCYASQVEELLAMKFARGRLSLPVPKILHHPPLPRRPGRRYGGRMKTPLWYICMEQCPGVPLSNTIDDMTPTQHDHIAAQLKTILHQMATYKPKWLGSVHGSPYNDFFFKDYVRPKTTFASVRDFHDHIRWTLELFCAPEFIESFMSRFPRNAAIRFTHGDLLPKNIIVNGSTITGIIDWETAGFYPEYWEYARMHCYYHRTPGWESVLRRLFPAPPREDEIRAVGEYSTIMEYEF